MELAEIAGPGVGAIDREREFRVRMADIDTNSHVNNVNYLAWALESIPADLRKSSFVHSIRGQFKREVPYGATVHGQSEPYLAATAESTWLPRQVSRIRAA
jgi:acyl-ACP thioesterase